MIAERRSAPRAGTVGRAALLLTATGVMSAVSIRHTLALNAPDAEFALGFAAALGLTLAALPLRPRRGVTLAAFAVVAATYLVSTIGLGGNTLGLALYVIAAALAYLATPVQLRPLAVAGFALWTPVLRVFGPSPTGNFFPGPLAFASLGALAFLVWTLLRDAPSTEERVRRIGTALVSIAVVSAVVERHLVVESPGLAPDDLFAIGTVVLLPLIVSARLAARTRDALVTGLALAAFALLALALLSGKGYHADTVIAPHRAAEVLLAGGDPYRDFDFAEAARRFGVDPALVTHYVDGSQVRVYDYPALSFLLVTPFVAAGVTDIRWIYVAELALIVLYVQRRAALPWRPLVAAAVVGNVVLTRQYVLAGSDPTWALLALVAWTEMSRRHLSPLALGLALASRQTAWLLAPFYVLATARREGLREAGRRALLALAAAAVPNLPFLARDPGAFLRGVLTPVLGPLEADGVGLVRLWLEGLIPPIAREAHTALAVGAYAAGALVLWWRWTGVAGAGPVLGLAPLYLAWRSLQSYFAFAPLFALAADPEVIESDENDTPEEADARGA